MSALFTDQNRKCKSCGNRAGVWPVGENDLPVCPECGAATDTPRRGRGEAGVTRYRTIVADPPWPHQRFYSGASGVYQPPYQTLSVDEIKGLPVERLAQTDTFSGTRRKQWKAEGKEPPTNLGCILFLWATQQFLWDARDVAKAWGFRHSYNLVWCKTPHARTAGGGTFASTVEFILVCRRGNPPPAKAVVDRQHFDWPRGEHSAKPEAFMDLVESVSHGPYLELFARRQRLGWDTYGNEALPHVELGS